MSGDKLRARWTSAEGRWLAGAVAQFLFGAAPDLPAGVGRHEGRWDLRGFWVPSPVAGPRVEPSDVTAALRAGVWELRDVHWQGLDLSHSRLSGIRFFEALIEDCRFDAAACGDWRLWGSTLRSCSFIGSDLRDGALGTWRDGRGNAWEQVRFDRADLRGASWSGGSLEDCSFADSRLAGVEFEQVSLYDCRFAGRVADVIFDGRAIANRPRPSPLVAVDFRAAQFRDVEFRGCQFVDVELPDQVRLIEKFPSVARQALQLLADDSSLEAGMLRAELETVLKLPGSEDSVGVFNRADYEAVGTELADLAEAVLTAPAGYACPVCAHRGLRVPPYQVWPPPSEVALAPPYEVQLGSPSYEVCPRCGFEFGNDDNPGTTAPVSFEQYRDQWVADGKPWFDEGAPDGGRELS